MFRLYIFYCKIWAIRTLLQGGSNRFSNGMQVAKLSHRSRLLAHAHVLFCEKLILLGGFHKANALFTTFSTNQLWNATFASTVVYGNQAVIRTQYEVCIYIFLFYLETMTDKTISYKIVSILQTASVVQRILSVHFFKA